jgi:trimeric autotransporter adhesin
MVHAQAFTDNTIDAEPPLPVKLVSFTGSKIHDNVQLNWITATEQNNSHFNIQRSSNGTDFQKIGRENGKGNSITTTGYLYTDFKIPNIDLFYRLEQVDVDGKTTLSPVVMIKKVSEQRSSLSVYPNPARNNMVSVSFENIPVGQYTISIVSSNGSSILQRTFDHRTPTEVTQLYMNQKPAMGLYIIRISNGAETIQQKIIIE